MNFHSDSALMSLFTTDNPQRVVPVRRAVPGWTRAFLCGLVGVMALMLSAGAAAQNYVSLASNPVTNRIYAASSTENYVVMTDLGTRQSTNIPVGNAPYAMAVNTVTNQIYVANRQDNTVSVIDGASNTTTTIAVGTAPQAIAVDEPANMVYVANGNSNSVSVINGATKSVVTTLPAGRSPNAVAVNVFTDTVYVTNYSGSSVTVINGATNTAASTVTVGANPVSVAVNPMTNKIYVANNTGNSVTVIDGASNGTATVPTGYNPVAVLVEPFTNQIFVANNGGDTDGTYGVTIIDGATNETAALSLGQPVSAGSAWAPVSLGFDAATLEVLVGTSGEGVWAIDPVAGTFSNAHCGGGVIAANPVTNQCLAALPNTSMNASASDFANFNTVTPVTVGTTPWASALNPVTNKVYVANYSSNNVSVIDGGTNSVATVTAGDTPVAVAINPYTNMAYVVNKCGSDATCASPGTVTAIDGSNNTTTIPVGMWPRALDVNPLSNKIYVANWSDSTVSVIDGATNKVTATLDTGAGPWAVAVNPLTDKAYITNNQGDTVTVVDGGANTTTTVNVGQSPMGVAIDPLTNLIYVTNYASGYVTVIEGATDTAVDQINVDPYQLDFIAVDPLDNWLCATSSLNGGTCFSGDTPSSDEVKAGLTAIRPGLKTDAQAPMPAIPSSIALDPVYDFFYTEYEGASSCYTGCFASWGDVTWRWDGGSFITAGSVSSLIANPVTHNVYAANPGTAQVQVVTPLVTYPTPLVTTVKGTADSQTVTTIPGLFATTNPNPSFSGTVTSSFAAANAYKSLTISEPAPRAVYYQAESTRHGWQPATITSAPGANPLTFTLSLSNLSVGMHYISVWADYGDSGTSASSSEGTGNSPITGNVITYQFAVLWSPLPTFTPAPGTYATAQKVAISDEVDGSTIYYTTDGSTPTTNSAMYTQPIEVSENTTIKAMSTAPNYSNSGVVSGVFDIQAATPTFQPAPGTYGSKQQVTILDSTPGATIYYTVNGTTPTPTPGHLYSVAIPVGTTTTVQAIATAPGYATSPVGSATYTFKPPTTPTVTWSSPAPIVYGAALSSIQLNATASVPGTFVYSPAAGTVLSAGPHTLKVTFIPSDGSNYNNATQSVSLTVNPATLTVTANNASMTYGDAMPSLTYSMTGFVNGETASVIGGTASMTTAAAPSSPVGNYTLTPGTGTLTAANYAFVFVSGTITVNRAALALKANHASRTYGTSNPTFTYTFADFRNGDTAGVVSGTPVVTTAATASSPVGTYPITITNGSLAAANYYFVPMNGSLTISKAMLTVTAANRSMTYGSALPTLTCGITGYLNGDSPGVVKGAPVLVTPASSSAPPWIYPIMISQGTLSATNYNFTFVNGTMTVNKAVLTVTATSLATTYGTIPQLKFSISGFVNNDMVYTGSPVVTTAATGTSPVGTYPITITKGTLAADNYVFQMNNGTLTIGNAILTVSANNLTMKQGSAIPALTYTMTGFVNGDTQAKVTAGSPSLSTTATTTSGTGVYPITIAKGTLVLENTNYAFQFVNGTLTVD